MVYAVILPLALMLGYMLETPTDLASLGTVGLVIGILAIPLALKWNQECLLLSWNMPAYLFFLPGRPELWLVMSIFSLSVAVLQRALNKEMKFIFVPSLVLPVVYLLLVVAVSAWRRVGFGMKALR